MGSVALLWRYLRAAGPNWKNCPPRKVLVKNRLPTEIANAAHSQTKKFTA